jgi:hypothetical protein
MRRKSQEKEEGTNGSLLVRVFESGDAKSKKRASRPWKWWYDQAIIGKRCSNHAFLSNFQEKSPREAAIGPIQ